MADGPRKSSRPVKIKREAGFVYEAESLNFLDKSVKRHSSISVSPEESANDFEGFENIIDGKDAAHSNSLDWSEIYSVPLLSNTTKFMLSESSVSAEESSSQSRFRHQNNQLFAAKARRYGNQHDLM